MSNNTTAGKPKVGGAVFRAPEGTALPTSATAEIGSGFIDLGTISEDGVSNDGTRETEEIKDWGGNVVLEPQTSKVDKFKMKFMDHKDVDVLKTVYGESNVSGTLETGIAVKVNAEELERHAWIIDMVLSEGDLKRICIPSGKVTEIGEITYKGTEAVLFDSTISCKPDKDGQTHYEYIQKKPAAASLSE